MTRARDGGTPPEPPASSENQRSTKRWACSARFSAAGAASMLVRGEVRDVSLSGLSLTTDLRVKQGHTLHLALELPTGTVEAVGEVRWVKRRQGVSDIGIRFVRLPDTAAKAITELMKLDASAPTKYLFR